MDRALASEARGHRFESCRARSKAMQDTVFIKGLRVKAVIGIYEWERRIRQEVVADIEMDADLKGIDKSDDIADTLDYKAIAKRARQLIADSRVQLIETLAEQLASAIINEFGVARVRVRLTKPGAVRGSEGVGVSIERAK